MWRKSIVLFSAIVVGYFCASTLELSAQPEFVKRGVFTYGINEREPINEVDSVSTDSTRIYFFTELVDLAGSTVSHRWSFDGKTMAEVPFQVGGARWRVYSSKKLIAAWAGRWKVEVVDADGVAMYEKTFVYYKAE